MYDDYLLALWCFGLIDQEEWWDAVDSIENRFGVVSRYKWKYIPEIGD